MIFIDATQVDSVVMYDCDDGHDLVGPSERVCTDQGTWTESDPVCNRKFSHKQLKIHETCCRENQTSKFPHSYAMQFLSK